MYLYFPDRRYGVDKVALVHGLHAQPGDLVEIDETMGVVLGDEVAFPELISPKALNPTPTVIIKQLLQTHTLAFIHAFMIYRFTTYASAMPLWTGDISQLIRQHKKIKTPSFRDRSLVVTEQKVTFQKITPTTEQQLIVFPDLRTMHQVLPEKIFIQPGVIELHGGMTVVQKAKAFRGIKQGLYHTIVSTHAEIFQDYFNLVSIVLIDQHKRRYKSQQDPRYRTPTVLKQLADLTRASLQTTGYTLSASIDGGDATKI